MNSTNGILIAALVFAGFIFYRLHQAQAAASVASPAPPAPPEPGDQTAPSGSPYIPLGQFAVPPDKLWLLIQPGQ